MLPKLLFALSNVCLLQSAVYVLSKKQVSTNILNVITLYCSHAIIYFK